MDEVNFYYGRLVARALNLPQPPCMANADFMSLREAAMSLQVAHRRFGNLLHDVLPDDLDEDCEGRPRHVHAASRCWRWRWRTTTGGRSS